MGYILKIVEGPNKGAEIALVEGVAVTLGKGDDCDIVLVDSTMPAEPLKVEASADGVTVDDSPLEPFAVKTIGATSFAIGPDDAPWGALKWPKEEDDEPETGDEGQKTDESKEETPPSDASEKPAEGQSEKPPRRRRGGCLGCLFMAILLILILVGLAWFFKDRLVESDRFEQFSKIGRGWYSRFSRESRDSNVSGEKQITLSDIAEKYGLSLVESNGVERVTGNLRTRRERLAATAEAYQAKPWVELDLTDDESFRSAADDALFTLTEGALKVGVATNRYLSIVGASSSPLLLKRTLEALNSDIPRLNGVDVSGVVFSSRTDGPQDDGDGTEADDNVFSGLPAAARTSRPRSSAKPKPSLPVCGILTTPYPCLVMRDGRRMMEGAAIGDSVIVEIGADSVTLTNSTGRFTWKP